MMGVGETWSNLMPLHACDNSAGIYTSNLTGKTESPQIQLMLPRDVNCDERVYFLIGHIN